MGVSPGLACCHLAAAHVTGTARHKAGGGELGLNPLTFLVSSPGDASLAVAPTLFFFFLFNHLSFESQDLIFSCSVPCGGGGEAASKQALLLLVGAQPVLVPPHITRTAPCHEGQAEGKHTAWHGLWFIARVFGANI